MGYLAEKEYFKNAVLNGNIDFWDYEPTYIVNVGMSMPVSVKVADCFEYNSTIATSNDYKLRTVSQADDYPVKYKFGSGHSLKVQANRTSSSSTANTTETEYLSCFVTSEQLLRLTESALFLSFYVKMPATTDLTVGVYNQNTDSPIAYFAPLTIAGSEANTWVRKVIEIPAITIEDQLQTYDTLKCLEIRFYFSLGATLKTLTVPTAGTRPVWTTLYTYTGTPVGFTTQTNLFEGASNTSASFYITRIQLEANTCTDFEDKPRIIEMLQLPYYRS
jgi:hypothetical protein